MTAKLKRTDEEILDELRRRVCLADTMVRCRLFEMEIDECRLMEDGSDGYEFLEKVLGALEGEDAGN